MPRYKCTLAYVGTRYAGWQIQEPAKAPLTIQGELEKVLHKVTGELVRFHGAGRTDAGVHAEGQVAHFTSPSHCKEKSPEEWEHIFHALLPADICVHKVERVHDDFHSRFDSISKSYTYTLWTKSMYMPPRLAPFLWACGSIDVERMQSAIPYLVGTHDFASLQNVGTPIEDTTRTINTLEIQPFSPWVNASQNLPLITINVNANGFLKQMVRNITGLLVGIGKNRFAPEDIPKLLHEKNRKKAPPTAPAQGLSLICVEY